nr:hypothetical protein [Tanacetum cinerariifolium]
MKNLFLDISCSVLREPNEKSLVSLYMVTLSQLTFKVNHTTKSSWRKWRSIKDIKPVNKGVILTLLHRSPLRLPRSPIPRKSRPGLVSKRRKPISSLRSIDESVAEGIPEKEPRVDDEDVDVQRALEELVAEGIPESVIYSLFRRQRRRALLTDSEVESDEDAPGIDAGVQGKGQAGPNADDQDEGQARPNPGDAVASQPLASPVVHARPNLEHMDLEVHENLTLTVEEHVILEKPARFIGSLSSLQHLTKDLSFGNLFFNDKPSEADNEKTTAEIKVESMVSVIIQQDTSAIPSMTTPIVDLTSRPDSPNRIGELKHIMANLIQDNKHLEERHERYSSPKNVGNQLLKTHEDHMMLYEALEKSMNHDHSEVLLKDLAEARKKKKKRRDSPKMPPGSPPHQPPPLPPPAGPSGAFGSSGSSQVPPPPPPPPSTNQEDLQMDDDMALDAQAQSSDDEDIENAHIPKVNLRQGWWKPLEEDRPATPEPVWSIPLSDVPYEMEECHKLLVDSVDDSIIMHNVSKPLPLRGPPGQVTIQSDFFFNKDLEYLRYGRKGSRPAHTSEGDHRAVGTYMRILSVVRTEVFSMYGYDYMKKIVLHRVDLNEHIIAKQDFKKDVDRSKEFMFAIQKRLKTGRIFRNLESFVGGRVRDGDYRLLKRTE